MRTPSSKIQLLTVFFSLLFGSVAANAACHAVTPAGSGAKSGADWNNAMAGLPSTLVRGDTYYLADSADYAYGTYTFNTSGSGTITIRKAQAADYGQNCSTSIAAGWNASTMGSGQASFSGMSFNPGAAGSNIIIDGNGTYAHQGCGGGPSGTDKASRPVTPSDCGIVINSNKCSSTAENGCPYPISIGGSGAAAVTGVQFRYMEWYGKFTIPSGSQHIAPEESFLWAWGSNIAHQFALDHIYAHNTGCTYLHQDGHGTRTESNSYFWATDSDPANCHGEATYDVNGTTVTDFNNIYRDINGSAVQWFDGSSFANSKFYNNIYYMSSPTPSWFWSQDGIAQGAVACGNGSTCSNFVFDGNTIVNFHGGFSAGFQLTLNGGSGPGSVARNNLWYNIDPALNINIDVTEDHNSFLNQGFNTSNNGTGDINVTSGSANPFVNWQAGNFHLTNEAANWIGGATLTSPYNLDADGVTRGNDGTWERGAYEYVPTSGQTPPPPSPPPPSGPTAPSGLAAYVQ